MYVSVCDFFFLVLLLAFGLGIYLFIYLFFLHFLLSYADGRTLVLWPGVRPETQRWEIQVQHIGMPESSRPNEM